MVRSADPRADRRIGESVLARIGNTPLLRLPRITRDLPPSVELYVKAEWFNPGGSVKDRSVRQIVEDAERDGRLTSDRIIIDSSSGNAGIAYAMIGAVKGYRVHLVVPANASEERKRILQAYGAVVQYSDPLEGSDGAILEVRRIVAARPDAYFWGDQYNNPSNVRAHYDTTGSEVFAQTDGCITHFVAGLGTSGTLVGVSRRLRELSPGTEIVAVEPDSGMHGIEGLKHMASAIVPGIYDPSAHDRKIAVRTEAAYALVRRLAREEGLLVGLSAGAAMVGALEVARSIRRGVLVALFPDAGDRYLSTA
ncbi:MAG: cysteine synthase family protein, partial [Armatimonadetes bacterium]|nr:cysteine synthase family protein [Armatimonadota bacterium]